MSLCRSNCLFKLFHAKNVLIRKVVKRHSALFINGAKLTDTFAYVTPHVDWAEIVAREDVIRRDLQRRRAHVDLEELKSIWQFYSEMLANKNELETKRTDIAKNISELMKANSDPDAIQKLKIHLHLIKENLSTLKVSLWSIEETAFVRTLQVPNYLHERTPTSENTVLHTHLVKPDTDRNHLESRLLVHDCTNGTYYLKDEAAIFELGATFYFSSMLRKNNYVQFSNPDFVKSVVVEGCGTAHTDPRASFILRHAEDSALNVDSRLHLVGGASLPSFFAYHTKNVLDAQSLPLKYFTMGRKYVPMDSFDDGLFSVNQSSAVDIFALSANPEEMDQILDELIDITKQIYSALGHHFRLSLTPADRLQQWESLRVSIEMFSTSLGKYVEVGNVSVSGDYISKRLTLTYKTRGSKRSDFPYVVSGTLLSVPRLLACALEQRSDFHLPSEFQVENWAVT